MLTATVTHVGGARAVTVHYPQSSGDDGATAATVEEKPGPSPIVPEVKELVWTSGAFVVFAVLMRYVLYPRLRRGMDARYESIRVAHEGADTTRATAKAEVAEYETELAGVKAEAAARVEAARRVLETERNEGLIVVNAEIAAQRAAAATEADEARAAVQGQIEAAVTDVASRAIELAIGKAPDPDVLSRVVVEVMSVGVTR
ncbi:MAG: ATP synthase F0 subunit B [Ilumatobacteraceae bacterium]